MALAYSDHSMFLFLSALIKGKYLELTGDEKFFEILRTSVTAIDENLHDGMVRSINIKKKHPISQQCIANLAQIHQM